MNGGGNPRQVNYFGDSAASLAEKRGDEEILSLFKEDGRPVAVEEVSGSDGSGASH